MSFACTKKPIPPPSIIMPPEPTPLSLGFLTKDGYQVVPVLLYHDVVKTPKKITDVSSKNFRKHMKYLFDNGYTTISTRQMFDFLNLKAKIPKKAVMITFDDGYKSIYNTIQDVLKEFDFRAVLFIYTDSVVGKYSSTLTWDQISKVSKDMFEIQVHSKTHADDIASRKIDETEKEYMERMESELLFPKKLLEKKIGRPMEYFAYPYGTFSEQMIELLKNEYGYKGAFTVLGAQIETESPKKYVVADGYNPFFVDPFKIRRIQILRSTDFTKFKNSIVSFKQEDF